MKQKLLFLITEDWFFYSHFLERALAARQAGFDVVIAAREGQDGERIRSAGLRFIPIDFVRRSMNPFVEFATILSIVRLYRRERPTLVHHIGAKPIFYGSLAACMLRGPAIINASVGMGYVFTSRESLARRLKPLMFTAYRYLMNTKRSRVIFENGDDLAAFVRMKLVRREDAILIRGAGVNLDTYRPHAEAAGVPMVVLVARMLKDKGVNEFVQAAHSLYAEGVQARFVLIGDPDPENPSSIPEAILRAWHGSQGVEWWGRRSDVAEVLASAHIACLPSYREGLPKSLLEAAACGLPIVTTDTVGCREVVVHGDNGLLVPVGNALALTDALRTLIADPELRRKMGRRSREHAESEFASERVIAETLAVYTQLAPMGEYGRL